MTQHEASANLVYLDRSTDSVAEASAGRSRRNPDTRRRRSSGVSAPHIPSQTGESTARRIGRTPALAGLQAEMPARGWLQLLPRTSDFARSGKDPLPPNVSGEEWGPVFPSPGEQIERRNPRSVELLLAPEQLLRFELPRNRKTADENSSATATKAQVRR